MAPNISPTNSIFFTLYSQLKDDIEILELYQQEPLSDGDDTLANTRLPSLEKDSDGHVESPMRGGQEDNEDDKVSVSATTDPKS